MKSYSQDYLDAIYTGHAYHKIKVMFGQVEVTDNIVSMKYVSMMHDGDAVTFGNSCAAQVELTIEEPPSNATSKNVTISLGVEIDENETEWVSLGKFVVTNIEIEKTQVKYTMYDNMAAKLNKRYKSFLDWNSPVSTIDIQEEITGATDVTFGTGTADEFMVTVFPQQCTYRDMIGFMAGMIGRDAVINSNGVVEYRCYQKVTTFDVSSDSVYEDEFKKEEADAFNFKKVSCAVTDDTTISSTEREATEAHTIIGVSNPYITQTIMDDYIYPATGRTISEYFTENFTPTTIKMVGNPLIEVGDIIKVYEDDENYLWAYVMKVTHEYDGGLITTIESKAETEEAQAMQYVSPSSGGSSGGGGGGGNITVDSAMSTTSTNPVQNKVIYAYIGNIGEVLDAIQGEEI